ncbi:MAG: receptor ligand binding family protein, partial [Leptolyngbyaceae cyanobacterium]
MSQKNDLPVLIIALLLTLGLLGGGGWWLYRTFSAVTPQGQGNNPSGGSGNPNLPGTTGTGGNAVSVQTVSQGEVSLLPGASLAKQQGVAAIAVQNYPTAVQAFETALQENRNDPESLIYLNNARIGTQLAYTVAVVIPSPASVDVAEELLRGVAHSQR